MPGKFSCAIERVLLTFWVGGLWTTGFIVAPLLFATLEDRALAGTLAGQLFTIMSYASLLCGSLLLLLHWAGRQAGGVLHWRPVVIGLMLLIVVAGEFLLAPMLAQLRNEGLSGDARFGQLHGIASALFLMNCLLGLFLVVAGQSLRSR